MQIVNSSFREMFLENILTLSICIISMAIVLYLIFVIEKDRKKIENEIKSSIGLSKKYSANDHIVSNIYGTFQGFIANDTISILICGTTHHYVIKIGTKLSLNGLNVTIEKMEPENNSIILMIEKF
jgi:predicted PurR-regulated permease PerM